MKNKVKAIRLLTEQKDFIQQLRSYRSDTPEFGKWWHKTSTILSNLFGEGTQQVKSFSEISYSLGFFTSDTPNSAFKKAYLEGLDAAEGLLEAKIHEIAEFWDETAPEGTINVSVILQRLFERFHIASRQLRVRHDRRSTLTIKDEYDVQDLLHVFLKLEFDDIRPEEWTPSYAGGSSRVDFLLKKEKVIIEVKKTRESMTERELGEQLIIDKERYQAHPDCEKLFCFIYDPEGIIGNPAGLENDLSCDHPLPTNIYIYPR